MEEKKEIEKILKAKAMPKNSKKGVNEWDLLEFKRRLNQPPPKSILRKNPEYGNDYIPLQFVEVMLDILFLSKEFVMRHKPDYIEGQTVFYMDVIVTHPVTLEKLVYSGTSVVGTMPNSDNYRDVHKRIPAGESFAILNGVQKIGRLFRPKQETFTKALDNYFEKEQTNIRSKEFERLKRMVDNIKTTADVKRMSEAVELFHIQKKINKEENIFLNNYIKEVYGKKD